MRSLRSLYVFQHVMRAPHLNSAETRVVRVAGEILFYAAANGARTPN